MMDFEARVQKVYECVLRPGMGAIDVGAHVGRHALEMLKCVAPGGFVLMFEPLPIQFAFLESMIAGDAAMAQMAQVHSCALSDIVGTTEFCIAVDVPGYSGIRERKYDVPTRVERIQVPVRRLDDMAANMASVDFIKIDTEGAEWNVLRGASATIDQHQPVITFEFGLSSYGAFDVDPAEVFDFFAEKDYIVANILGQQLDLDGFIKSSINQHLWDYVAVPWGRWDELSFPAT